MEGLINYRNEGLLKELLNTGEHRNTLWGTEYILADSTEFMGKTGGERYDRIIDMLIRLRGIAQTAGIYSINKLPS